MKNKEEVQALIQLVEKADSADSLLEAVESLADSCREEAIPTLIQVLTYNNPGAAVAAVEGLIKLGDVAVPSLLEQIDGYNYGARAWATRALAGIGHPISLNLLKEAARGDFSLSVRRSAACGLGNICWSKLSPPERESAQAQTVHTLVAVSHDPEWVVRYGAVVGLQNLAASVKETQSTLFGYIVEGLETMGESEPELGVCARIKLALQAVMEV